MAAEGELVAVGAAVDIRVVGAAELAVELGAPAVVTRAAELEARQRVDRQVLPERARAGLAEQTEQTEQTTGGH